MYYVLLYSYGVLLIKTRRSKKQGKKKKGLFQGRNNLQFTLYNTSRLNTHTSRHEYTKTAAAAAAAAAAV